LDVAKSSIFLTENRCIKGGQYANAFVTGLNDELEGYRCTLLGLEDSILTRRHVPLSYVVVEIEKVYDPEAVLRFKMDQQ
jgi:hypothetical protein